MNQTVSCPHCQGQLTVSSELAGVTVSCPLCNGRFTFSSSPAAAENTPFEFLQDKPSNFRASPATSLEKKKKTRQPWELYICGGFIVLILLGWCSWTMVNPTSSADKWREEYEKDFRETVENTNKREKESDELKKRVAILEEKRKASIKWIDEFAKATTGQTGIEAVKRLKELGLILKIDYEARNVIIDHDGWQRLSEIEKGRWLVTWKIAEDMATKSRWIEHETGKPITVDNVLETNPQVILFDSITGQSLSSCNEDWKITIFR